MEQGTVLFVSHDSAAVLNLCKKTLWLENGQIQMQGSAKMVCERYLASEHQFNVFSAQGHLVKSDMEHDQGNTPLHDMRLDFINQSKLRNDIEVFSFRGNGRGFGTGGVRIVYACLLEQKSGRELSWVIGGEPVCVAIEFIVCMPIRRVVVGFFVKDRLGQILFGDNTYLATIESPISFSAGERAVAVFPFQMPILPQGLYSADVAVADGTPSEHVQLQWIHDAFKLESKATSTSTGLIGLPFGRIEIRKVYPSENALVS